MLVKSSSLPYNDVLAVDSSEAKADAVGLIPWFSLRPGAFISDLCKLWKKGCRRFVLVAPTTDLTMPWSGLPPHLRTAFDRAIGVCDTPSLENLQGAIGKTDLIPPWARSRVHEFAEARILYEDSLSRFSHNSKTDLSNQFLAPARLLNSLKDVDLSKTRKHWKTVWQGTKKKPADSFKGIVLEPLKNTNSTLGQELVAAAERITKAFDKGLPFDVLDLENVMTLLTSIRASAGIRTHIGGSSASKKDDGVDPITTNGDDLLRVLVVDDHAASWRPVFEQLQRQLAEKSTFNLNVRFEFSLDGVSVRTDAGKAPEPLYFSFYDLVILDVFLRDTTGIDILRRLRRDFSQLPVLLWTTSRDEEVAAEATLANGILLKKTVTWQSLGEAVARWVQRGKAMRTASLPNPFFNHTIQNLDHRKLAVDFHEWCLKQLDSFHALDNEYFRYFTDHGGRHIVKLLELLEQALQPFLQDYKDLLLPKEDAQRELELLGLYLTVICHELGMFPMRIGSEVENFAALGRGYLKDVRSLHAVRGMVLLHDSNPSPDNKHIGQYWNDTRGRELGAALRAKGSQELADRMAVLVGYHARVFKSLDKGDFLEWEKSKKHVDARLKKLASPVPSLSRTDETFQSTYLALARAFKDTTIRERLRCQCALFRFVDALDITFSRNPAEFLVGSSSLAPEQYGENLKRELCQSAKIENGEVRVVMMPPAPTFGLVSKIIKHVPTLLKKNDNEGAWNARKAQKFLTSKEASERIAEPWTLDLLSATDKDRLDILEDRSALLFQKPLDCWLKNVWEALIDDHGNAEFVNHLKKLKILDGKLQQPTLTFDGARKIASITALSVAGELLDEYKAIVESGLSHKIKLAPFQWLGVQDWSQLPCGLPTLEKVMPEPGEQTI